MKISDQRWFEDYLPGSVHEFGSIVVDEQEVLDFGHRFDPQPFHIDVMAARTSVFRGLIASGWHTSSMTMRLIVEHYLSEVSSLGSPGIDELKWLLPVRPGDELKVRITVLDTRRSRSRPDRGIVRSKVETLNQEKKVVMQLIASNFIRCRDPYETG